MRTFLARPLSPLVLSIAFALASCGGGSGGGDAAPTIQAPAAGTYWAGTNSVRWTSGTSEDGTVRIQLSTDGGATYPVELATSTADDGWFAFDTTGQVDGASFRVRVVPTGRAAITSGVFTIDNTVPVVSLDSPSGGEVWGGSNEVRWTTTDANPDTVRIEASTDGGANYTITVAGATADDGTYAWDTAALVDGTTYRLRVTATDRAGNVSAPSTLGSDFELDNSAPTIALTAPTGGESMDGPFTITWNTTDLNPQSVRLLLSTNSGTSYDTTVVASTPDTGSFEWGVGQAPDSSTLRIRAIAIDEAGNESAPSDSPGDFTVSTLRLTGSGWYRDEDGDGTVNAGDTIYLLFDKSVTVNSTAASSFDLPVAGETLGVGATVAAGPEANGVTITLGTSPVLTTHGTFEYGVVGADAASGIDVSFTMAADAIESTVGGLDASPSAYFDVTPSLDVAGLSVPATSTGGAVAGDLDGDGDDDVVVGYGGATADRVLLNDGFGGFSNGQAFGSATTTALALGDVDGDGDLDLVAGTDGADRVWTNDGAATFTDTAQTLGTQNSADVALADLDCDGDLDLFVAHDGGTANRVYTNDGTGTFTDSGQALGAADTRAVALGDVDGDGDVDAVAGNFLVASRVWVNDGTGTFSSGSSAGVTQTHDVALGDLDGDGALDLFVATLGQNEVRLNSGGTFTNADQFLGNNDARGVALVDVDGDGDLDAVTSKNADADRYWLNDGTGTFAEAAVRGATGNGTGIVALRADADGDVDVFGLTDPPTAFTRYRSGVAGGHALDLLDATPASVPLAGTLTCCDVGDVDGDGDPDVVVGVDGGGNRVVRYTGSRTFAADGATYGSAATAAVLLADVDCDGDLDWIEGVGGGAACRVWRNDGFGGFTSASTFGALIDAADLDAADVDGDGDLDIAVADGTLSGWLFLNDGNGTFTDSLQSLGSGAATAVRFADVEGDGDADLVLGRAAEMEVLRNDGSGTFGAPTSIATGARALAVADRDRDGDVDLYCAVVGANWQVFDNDGTGTFATTGPANAEAFAIATFDADLDAHPDAVVATNASSWIWYTGTAGGVASQEQSFAGATDFASVGAADFDGDGGTDVVAVSDSVGVWFAR